MKYLLLIYQTEGAQGGLSEQETGEYMGKWGAFDTEARAKTTVLDGAPLEGVAAATTVRSAGGKTVMTDGPFAETKEQLGGFYVVDAKNLDEATGHGQHDAASGVRRVGGSASSGGNVGQSLLRIGLRQAAAEVGELRGVV